MMEIGFSDMWQVKLSWFWTIIEWNRWKSQEDIRLLETNQQSLKNSQWAIWTKKTFSFYIANNTKNTSIGKFHLQ